MASNLIPDTYKSRTSRTFDNVNLINECVQDYHAANKEYVDYNLLGLVIVNSNNYYCELGDSVIVGSPPSSDWNLFLPKIPTQYANKSKIIDVINISNSNGKQFHVKCPPGYTFFNGYLTVKVKGKRTARFIYIGNNRYYAVSGNISIWSTP